MRTELSHSRTTETHRTVSPPRLTVKQSSLIGPGVGTHAFALVSQWRVAILLLLLLLLLLLMTVVNGNPSPAICFHRMRCSFVRYYPAGSTNPNRCVSFLGFMSCSLGGILHRSRIIHLYSP